MQELLERIRNYREFVQLKQFLKRIKMKIAWFKFIDCCRRLVLFLKINCVSNETFHYSVLELLKLKINTRIYGSTTSFGIPSNSGKSSDINYFLGRIFSKRNSGILANLIKPLENAHFWKLSSIFLPTPFISPIQIALSNNKTNDFCTFLVNCPLKFFSNLH